ncbi:MAG TPA: hypothetical protein PLP14_11690, partial [Chitinophagaceae bacterium]|nr:hypothetical protein [Chitinophagaceae bacterium]
MSLINRFLSTAFVLLMANPMYAETKYTLSGYIRDGNSGENLPSASVGIVELKRGVNTNAYGFYSISLPS